MLGFMPGASTLLTCLLAFSTLGALAAPTNSPPPPPPELPRGRPPPRPASPVAGPKEDLTIQQKQELMLYAHYAGIAYCTEAEGLGGKQPSYNSYLVLTVRSLVSSARRRAEPTVYARSARRRC
jgi:hypothetical protein